MRSKTIEAYELEIVNTTKQLEQAEEDLQNIAFVDVTEQAAPPKGEWQVEEVVESGLLLTEYAQHLREFFVEGQEYSLPYLESKSYTRGETGVDVLEAVGGKERTGTSQLDKASAELAGELQVEDATDLSEVEQDDLEEAGEVIRDAEQELVFEFSREDELESYDDLDMMDKQVPIKKLLDPVTGEVEEGMPIVVDGASAAKAHRVARKKFSQAVRDGKNPMEALGLTEELAQNRLAIREFLASKYEQSIPFPVVSFIERTLEIIAENPGFRESEALNHIARKVKSSKMLQDVQIEIMPWEQYSKIASVNESGYSAATYIPQKNKIFVSDVFGDLDGTPMENLVSSIIHEAIHVPTKAFIDVGYAYHTGDPVAKKLLSDTTAGEEMGRLYGQINNTLLPMLRKKAGPNHFYALSSIDELLSEVGSDASFREFLRNQKLTNEDRKALGIEKKGFLKTAWDYIVHVLSMLLGIGSNQTPELLQYTDKQLNKVIDLADGLSLMGHVIHQENVRGVSHLNILAGTRVLDDKLTQTQKDSLSIDWFDGTKRVYIPHNNATIRTKFEGEKPLLYADGWQLQDAADYENLGEMLNHPELFKHYPMLKDVKVVADYGEGENRGSGFFGEWDSIYKKWKEPPRIRLGGHGDKLIHEIQHAVDTIEGFPSGTNQFSAGSTLQSLVTMLSQDVISEPGFMGETRYRKAGEYKPVRGEPNRRKLSPDRPSNWNPKKVLRKINLLKKVLFFKDEQGNIIDNEVLDKSMPDRLPRLARVQLYNLLDTVETVVKKSMAEEQQPSTIKEFMDSSVEMEYRRGPVKASVRYFMYYMKAGEITSRVSETLFTAAAGKIKKDGDITFDQLALDQASESNAQTTVKQALEGQQGWVNPTMTSLLGLEEFVRSSMRWDTVTNDMRKEQGMSYNPGMSRLEQEEVTIFLNDLKDRVRQQAGAPRGYSLSEEPPMPRPDEAARIGHEAQAAGLNELMEGLTVAYREVQDMLPPETTLQDFIDNYGKLALKWKKNKKVTKAMEAIQKLLNPFQVEAKNVRITDAGRNRTAKNYGIRAAIAFNERTREQARKEASEGVDKLELYEEELKAGAKVFDALARRKMHSNEEMVGWIESKLKNNMTVQRLQKLSDYLPNEILNQEDIKMLNKISKDDILDVMEKAIEIDNFEGMNDEKMNEAIRNMSTRWFSGGSTQSSLARVAMIIAIKDSKDIMFLFRLARNKIGEEQQQFYDAAIEIAKADTIEKLKEIDYKFPGRVSTKFGELVTARARQIELKYEIPRVQNKVKINQRIDEVLGHRTNKYRYAMGELENFDIRNGVKIKHAYQEDGEWKIGEYEVEFKGGELKDRKEFIKVNRKTLEFLRQEKGTYGTEPWWDLMREQAEMALSLPVTQQWAAVRRSAWMAGLESVNQRFSRMGYEGKRLAGMTARTVALYRDLISKAQFHSKEFNRAYENVLTALDIGGQEFYTGMYQEIFWWFDNHPEYAGDEATAFSKLWKHLKSKGNVSKKSRLNENSRNAVRTLVEKTIAARDYEAQVNRDLGNRIKDDEFKVQSYLDGEKMVDFYRMPIDMGYATLPRAINDSKVTSLINYMTDQSRGDYTWSGRMDEMPVDAKMRELLELGEVEQMGQEMQKLFDEEITVRFLDEFMGSLNRKSLFYGPKDSDGWGNELGNSYVLQKWDASKGSIVAFMDSVFNDFIANQEPQRRGQWYLDFYKQLHERFQELKRVDRQIRSKAESETRETEALKHVPRSLDARQIESRLPKGFFLYDMYDETSTSIRMAMFAGASVFGRDGTKATQSFKEGRKKLKDSYDLFASVISEVT